MGPIGFWFIPIRLCLMCAYYQKCESKFVWLQFLFLFLTFFSSQMCINVLNVVVCLAKKSACFHITTSQFICFVYVFLAVSLPLCVLRVLSRTWSPHGLACTYFRLCALLLLLVLVGCKERTSCLSIPF